MEIYQKTYSAIMLLHMISDFLNMRAVFNSKRGVQKTCLVSSQEQRSVSFTEAKNNFIAQ